MAGDWSKIEHCTPDKPEIMRIAARLQISLGDAFLACFKVWRWADQQSYNGNAPGVTASLLNCVVGVSGLAEAMIEVGWLQVGDDGLTVPKFGRHNSQSAKQRALGRNRVQLHRMAQKLQCNADGNAPGVTSALPEKRREEKSRRTPLPPEGEPIGFSEFWVAYPYKDGRKKAVGAWRKLAPPPLVQADILAALQPSRWPQRWREENGRFIPLPASWLNGRRWEDEGVKIGPPAGESLDAKLARVQQQREADAKLRAEVAAANANGKESHE